MEDSLDDGWEEVELGDPELSPSVSLSGVGGGVVSLMESERTEALKKECVMVGEEEEAEIPEIGQNCVVDKDKVDLDMVKIQIEAAIDDIEHVEENNIEVVNGNIKSAVLVEGATEKEENDRRMVKFSPGETEEEVKDRRMVKFSPPAETIVFILDSFSNISVGSGFD